jgi:anti-sigma B factor antagonist
MEITVSRNENSGRVEIRGDVDEKGAEELKAKLREMANLKEVTIDMSGVAYIGSSGIGKLLLFYKNIAMQGGKVFLVNVQNDILQLLHELKLDTIFTITGK